MRIVWKHPDTPLLEEHQNHRICHDATLEPGEYRVLDPHTYKEWREGEMWTFGQDRAVGTLYFLPRTQCDSSLVPTE